MKRKIGIYLKAALGYKGNILLCNFAALLYFLMDAIFLFHQTSSTFQIFNQFAYSAFLQFELSIISLTRYYLLDLVQLVEQLSWKDSGARFNPLTKSNLPTAKLSFLRIQYPFP